jgi:erythromycin esterase-like protein
MVTIGFAFHEGTYTAWGKKGINIYGTSPSRSGSIEWLLKSSGIPNLILDLRLGEKDEAGSKFLGKKMNFRSIGSPARKRAFSKRNVAKEFDALVFFEKTTPSACFRINDRSIRKDIF